MRDFKDKVVVITGAGSGIGQALAQEFDRRGARLALSDVKAKTLEATAATLGKPALTMAFDVADRAAVEDFRNAVVAEYGQVDIVINNAGVALSDTIEHVSMDDFEWLMNINFWGVVYGTKTFLPDLKQRPEASLVNISSVFGIIAVPTQGTYNASKFAVRGMTEALRHEMEDEGSDVHVMCVHPGGIKTNIARNARFRVGPGGEDREAGVKQFDAMARTSPAKAAATIIKGIEKRKPRCLIGPDAYIIDSLQRRFPVSYWSLMRKLMPKAS